MGDPLGTSGLRLEREGSLAWCVIDRPSAPDALTPGVCLGSERAGGLVDQDPELSTLIITGLRDVFAPLSDLGGAR